MLTIRLQRTGTKNKPQFRIVLAEAHRAAGKKFLEVLGHYQPASKQFGIKDEARLKYWIGQNVYVSPSVHNLLVEKKVIEGKKTKAWRPKVKEASAEAAAPAPSGETPNAPAAEASAPATPASEAPAETPATASEPPKE